ncbi:MAG: PQQ-like beta-propeller repeat protein [Verrucomicrobiota bacterium]|nr:PQQ-like beta-propeller repeat protein [Verrucomicrobiota bacterium]
MRPLAVLLLALTATPLFAENWPVWRGPRLDGTSLEKQIPVKWSATENVVWRTELPGGGHASPILWGNKIFTVAADPGTEERLLICLDRASGKMLWQRAVLKSPMERKHRENSHASSTPATDGERIFCTFLDGHEVVVAAYDFAGNQLWLKRPGVFSSVHGFCSTPTLHDGKVIVNCDHDGDGYIVALGQEDGRERWRIDRPNKTRSYCTPLIRKVAGRTQMVLSGSKCVTSYDPDTGKLWWIIDGPTDQFVASMVYSERANLFFLTAGFPEHHILAIRPGGRGNVTQTHIAWRTTHGAAYVPSPICEGDYFLVISDLGFAHCFEAKTGALQWQERFGRQHASLVSADGLVYFLNDKGTCNVVRPGPKFELVASNETGEPTYASPALSEGQIFIRGEKSLFCIGAVTR